MIPISEDTKIKIKEYLEELNCCKRCILRYLGYTQCENGSDAFIHPEEEDIFSNNVSSRQEPKKVKSNPCRACLDILNDSTLEFNAHNLPVGFEEYKIDKFTSTLTCPISLSIRECAIFISLKDKFPDVYNNVEFSSIQSAKTVFKISISNILAVKLTKTASKAANFQVNINIQYPDEQKETANLRKVSTKKLSRSAVTDILADCKDDVFKTHFPVPPRIQDKITTFTITYSSSAVFLGGRYLKFSREMGQSPFVVNDKAITETSVQDILFDSISQTVGCDRNKLTFSASGREDSDTRMLGQGRPFYIQINTPKFETITEDQCRKIEESILKSNTVVVLSLQQVTQAETKKIKFGEQEKRKHYRALCKTLAPNVEDVVKIINDLKGPIEVRQATPIRVLHRRTQMIRTRCIYQIKAATVERYPSLFYLDLITQAGTYVKEFVHGDLDRTNPNLSNIIGYSTDVVALDVTHVELDWPTLNE